MAPVAVEDQGSNTAIASTSKVKLETSVTTPSLDQDHDHAQTTAHQAKKRRWRPARHLEAPAPPPVDPKLVEEMLAQQAAQSLGYEGRRIKKFMQRRTVDYWGSVAKWNHRRSMMTTARKYESNNPGLWPTPHEVVNLMPPAAYANPSTSLATTLVHTSTNKIRCPVNVVRWMPEARRILTGSTSGEFTLWNGLTFNFETIMQAHDSAIRSFEWSRSGAWLISADQNGTIKYFQSNMNNLQAFQGHREAIRALSFSPDDQRFVSASDDSTMKIWGFDEAREEKALTGHGWDVKCVDWHQTKGLIVSGSKDNLVKFWDPRSNTTLGTFHGHKNTVQACKWSPDGNLVVTASRDQVLKVYDIRAMNDIYTLKGHKKEVCSVDWHPVHHDTLVSGGSEGSILYWSLRAENPEAPIDSIEEAHESNVWSLQWHPFGHILCSGSNDHTTRFWSRSRPGDGLSGETETETRNKWAAKRGTDWEDEFIPGLTSQQPNRSFIPSGGSRGSEQPPGSFSAGALANAAEALNTLSGGGDYGGMGGPGRNGFEDEGAIPGLNFSSAGPPRGARGPPPHMGGPGPPPQPPVPYGGYGAPPGAPPGGAYGSFYGGGGGAPMDSQQQQQQQQQYGGQYQGQGQGNGGQRWGGGGAGGRGRW